jgi:bifunctional non-homologous end joining protein LigD
MIVGQDGLQFVVQKHSARQLHYDFRLEVDGVLKSWAVPKGPCLDPAVKRLAVEVDDHAIEFGTFEGVIADGEYGAGAIIVWDHGTWTGDDDPVARLGKGQLTFCLQGEKLRGSWRLVRMRYQPDGRGRQWLLIKEADADARDIQEFDVVEQMPASVLTGRTIEKVKAETHGPCA